MKRKNKVQFFYMASILFMCIKLDIVHAQAIQAAKNEIELRSLKINHHIDLSHIFKPFNKRVKKKQKVDVDNLSKLPIAVQLVGTVILGEKKTAWLKVENQVYQLKSGQLIPGTSKQISQINPESVVLIHPQSCGLVDSCDSSQTLTIRDVLF